MEKGKWIKTTEQLPPPPVNEFGGDNYIATVVNNQVVAVSYVKTTVRGKKVLRWEWNGKICPWDVIAYMPFPEPYTE